MTKDLKVSIVQTKLFWQEPNKNIRHLNKLLSTIKKKETDIIVLPEMFTTGFSMMPNIFAEEMNGPAMQWMQDVAKSLNVAVCGSLMIKEKNKFYNRLIWMNPDGSFETYNKRHLFRMGKEDQHYEQGKTKTVVTYKGWKINLQICYDLRFPIWSRNSLSIKKGKHDYNYDAMIYVANWPAVRSFPWQQLLIARAIENQAYVVGVNRIGKDGNGIDHSGDSVVINPIGKKLSKTKGNKSSVETIVLSAKELTDFRKKFPVLMDADKI